MDAFRRFQMLNPPGAGDHTQWYATVKPPSVSMFRPKRPEAFTRQLMLAHGLPEHDAAVVAHCLVSADLRGVDPTASPASRSISTASGAG